MNYVHDYNDYISIVTRQVLVTRKGRVYMVERSHHRCSNLFIKYTYCKMRPQNLHIELNFSLWNEDKDTVVIATWDYCDDYFCDSKLSTADNPIVSFTRRFIEVDRRFRDLLYGHCLRSGDKSFNLNEVFSAALTFNTRMSINDNDVRAMNRVNSTELLDAVVVIYCIAYRERFNAGKKMERYVADEKIKRSSRNIGFTDFVRCCVKLIRQNCGVMDKLYDVWNGVIDKIGESAV